MIKLFKLLGSHPSFKVETDTPLYKGWWKANDQLRILIFTDPELEPGYPAKYSQRAITERDFNSFKNYVYSTLFFVITFLIFAVWIG